MRSATAWAARPSPRPVKPRPSVVVARTLTFPASTPSAPASFSLISVRASAIRGSCPTRTQSALTRRQPASRTSRYAFQRRSTEEAPRYCSSSGREEGADVAEVCRAEERVDERVRDHVSVRMPDEPARVLERDAAQDERYAVLECVRVDPDPDPELAHASEASAVGELGERVDDRHADGRLLEPAPRPAPDVHRRKAGRERREHVVVHAVADVGDICRSAASASLTTSSKNLGSGLRTPRLADDEMTSAGSADSRAQRSRSSVWLPTIPTRSPSAHRLEAGDRVRIEVVELVRDAVPPAVGPVDPELAPRARRAPHRARSSPREQPTRRAAGAPPLTQHAPPPLLVDEGLADVEEHGVRPWPRPPRRVPVETSAQTCCACAWQGCERSAPTRPQVRAGSRREQRLDEPDRRRRHLEELRIALDDRTRPRALDERRAIRRAGELAVERTRAAPARGTPAASARRRDHLERPSRRPHHARRA